jgi:hypothetical protein
MAKRGDPAYYLGFDEQELDLLIEGAEILRLYQQGFSDENGRVRLYHVSRLEYRLKRRKERRVTHQNNDRKGATAIND